MITSHCCSCRHEKEDCLNNSSDTNWSLLSSLNSKSFGFLEKTKPFLICWVEMFPRRIWTVTNWFIRIFPKISAFSTKADMKFNISLTATALLMMEMTIVIPLFAIIRVKQKHFTLKFMVLKWFVQFLTRTHRKFFLMFQILSETAKTLTIHANGKLHQWLWKPNFMRTITQKLSLIVKLVTLKHPMRTLRWIKRLKFLRKQISLVHYPLFSFTNQRGRWNWQLTHWIVIRSWWIKRMIPSWKLSIHGFKKQIAHKNCPLESR